MGFSTIDYAVLAVYLVGMGDLIENCRGHFDQRSHFNIWPVLAGSYDVAGLRKHY